MNWNWIPQRGQMYFFVYEDGPLYLVGCATRRLLDLNDEWFEYFASRSLIFQEEGAAFAQCHQMNMEDDALDQAMYAMLAQLEESIAAREQDNGSR